MSPLTAAVLVLVAVLVWSVAPDEREPPLWHPALETSP